MIRTRHLLRFAALTLGLPALLSAAAVPFSTAAAQGAPQSGQDLRDRRESMWPAPTAEDWKRPCLVTWQRSFEDALAVSRETGKPILVCVNMDGEIASEHYAGVRYRQPEIAALYEPYVTVIASVYRHNPRDYDEEGQRILCPRFGSVTCGEHIAIEPGLYGKFFEGQRVAPRHIGLELDGQEMYDVFYAWDTDTIFNALREGVADRPVPPPTASADRPLFERVASRDIEDRTAVEIAYSRGDRETRRRLLDAALALGGAAPVEVLRLAIRGLDLELGQLARRGLARSTDPAAVDLIAEALRVPMEASERDALIAALARLGESSPRARTLAIVHQGLVARSSAVDVESWSRSLAGAGSPGPVSDRALLVSRLENQVEASKARPADAAQQLELAESFLALAVEPKTERKYARLLFEDARRAALEAERLGATGWRVNAAIAVAADDRGDAEEAQTRAEAAVSGMSSDVSGASGANGASAAEGAQGLTAMRVLAIFADARWLEIRKALIEKTAWPAQWLTDMDAAYRVLAQHPHGTERQVATHYDLLKWLGAAGAAARALDEGLARFPDSGPLHERLRARTLEERGVEGLEAVYEAMLREKGAGPNAEWFAGYASLVTAEFKKRAGRDGEALSAYDRAIAHFERAVAGNPESRASADHYVALALAGRAWLAYESEDYERATAELLASFERRPEAAASLDGLNRSPVSTARLTLARLADLKRDELAAKLQAALEKLDPELLRPPEYDRETQRGPGRENRPQRRPRTQDR